MYQVGTAIEFRAQHIMHGLEGPEGELHEHDYRLEVIVEREQLDDRGMVCDIDVLEAVGLLGNHGWHAHLALVVPLWLAFLGSLRTMRPRPVSWRVATAEFNGDGKTEGPPPLFRK